MSGETQEKAGDNLLLSLLPADLMFTEELLQKHSIHQKHILPVLIIISQDQTLPNTYSTTGMRGLQQQLSDCQHVHERRGNLVVGISPDLCSLIELWLHQLQDILHQKSSEKTKIPFLVSKLRRNCFSLTLFYLHSGQTEHRKTLGGGAAPGSNTSGEQSG